MAICRTERQNREEACDQRGSISHSKAPTFNDHPKPYPRHPVKKIIDPRASNSQIDFLGKFDRDSVKEEKLVGLILKQVPNVKFLRSKVRFSTDLDEETKDKALKQVENILFNLATIAWERSRWVPKYKYENITHFLDMTLDSVVLNCTDVISREEVQQAAVNVTLQTVAPFINQQKLLGDSYRRIETIISNFRTLKFLLQ